MFPIKRLRTKFILAGGILVAATLLTSFWSALTFFHLNSVVATTVRENQLLIDLIAELSGSLEREDDCLLLSLSADIMVVRNVLQEERSRGDEFLRQVRELLEENWPNERDSIQPVEQSIQRYRDAGEELLATPINQRLQFYHQVVNDNLRLAVHECQQIRDLHFRLMRDAAVAAGYQAKRGTWIVFGLAGSAFILGTSAMAWLARSILLPIKQLAQSVDAIRDHQLDHRIAITNADELGELAEGFNRMADSLNQYRESSLGELLAAKHTLESTLNALPDAVMVVNPDGVLTAANPLATTILEKLHIRVGSRFSDLPIYEKHRRQIQSALAGQTAVVSRSDFHHTLEIEMNGCRRKFCLAAMPIEEFFPNRFGAVIILDDVTDFARLDELRSELIGVASHELKSPLTTLRMNLMMLMEEGRELRPQHYQLLSAAVDGLEELGFTVDELLDVSRIEAGQLQLQLAPINLGGVLNQAIKGLKTRFEDAQIELEINGVVDSLLFLADPPRITSVLVNLFSNALKYAPPQSKIIVQATSRQNTQVPGKNNLQIEVIDQGKGVPEPFRERIFEKFFRVEHQLPANQSNVRGTGIGLYLCREIVQAHGGTISCHVGPQNRGTSIVMQFPLHEN